MDKDAWSAADSPENITERAAAAERERVRVQFYATYDVMTGVRIAATLGGFFALMVFLIVYKSRSKSVKALNDPKLVEFAEAVVAEEQAEEEERQLTAAIEEALEERARIRLELGTASGPSPRRSRIMSYGGYGPPPRRTSGARVSSLPGSALRCSRRPSSVTCSSSGSEYLERRGSNAVRAPLASLAWSRAEDSVVDSVFAEDSASTDDEVEQFSTDSAGEAGTELASRPVPVPLPVRVERDLETLF